MGKKCIISPNKTFKYYKEITSLKIKNSGQPSAKLKAKAPTLKEKKAKTAVIVKPIKDNKKTLKVRFLGGVGEIVRIRQRYNHN